MRRFRRGPPRVEVARQASTVVESRHALAAARAGETEDALLAENAEGAAVAAAFAVGAAAAAARTREGVFARSSLFAQRAAEDLLESENVAIAVRLVVRSGHPEHAIHILYVAQVPGQGLVKRPSIAEPAC